LNEWPLGDVVDGFLSDVATIKRVDLLKAAEDWIASRQPKTVAKDGKRPQLSPGYHYDARYTNDKFQFSRVVALHRRVFKRKFL